MCRDGLIHLLSSDAHRPRKRGFALEAAYGLLDREVGAEYSEKLRSNSLQVIQDEKVQAADQLRKQRKAWFI
jgi:protein-tyrosine phosphatase